MNTRLWCAGILCPHPELKRIHLTCARCCWRRRYYGKFVDPPKWIFYRFFWDKERWAVIDVHGRIMGFQDKWTTIRIDPRGHFVMLRCSIIVTLDKIMAKIRWIRKPFMEVCEFFANYPTF